LVKILLFRISRTSVWWE